MRWMDVVKMKLDGSESINSIQRPLEPKSGSVISPTSRRRWIDATHFLLLSSSPPSPHHDGHHHHCPRARSCAVSSFGTIKEVVQQQSGLVVTEAEPGQ